MTEVVLALLLVLIPLFVFGWILYTHSQVRTTALSAARYAAWERTVWLDGEDTPSTNRRSESEIEHFMLKRFFGRPEAEILSTHDDRAMKNENLPSFYALHNGDNLLNVENTEGKTGEGERPTLALWEDTRDTTTVGDLYNGISSVMKKLGAEPIKLENKGLYVARVNVKVNAVKGVKLFEDMNLKFEQQAAVLTDAWSAAGKINEEERVRTMVPVSLLDIEIFRQVAAIFGSATPFQEFRPGCVRGDVVPDGSQKSSPMSHVCTGR
ncbi:hypothetical protein FACS1894185_3680 [Betaproteobacteria bacterium]|nr:hypothetical protein FACS1894185_3680 [Betaproteobacteria bacterium]